MYVNANEWRELPKSTGGFGAFTPEGQWVPGPPNRPGLVPAPWCPAKAQFGRYELVAPKLLMWEKPGAVPMSVTGSDAAAWQGLGGFGEGELATGAALGVGTLVIYGLSLLMLGGAIIWVVKAIRKG